MLSAVMLSVVVPTIKLHLGLETFPNPHLWFWSPVFLEKKYLLPSLSQCYKTFYSAQADAQNKVERLSMDKLQLTGQNLG